MIDAELDDVVHQQEVPRKPQQLDDVELMGDLITRLAVRMFWRITMRGPAIDQYSQPTHLIMARGPDSPASLSCIAQRKGQLVSNLGGDLDRSGILGESSRLSAGRR